MPAPDLDCLHEDFGPFRLERRLGTGGMATVHSAVHRATGQRVALKRLLPQLAHDTALVRQFRREAEIAKALAHPNMAAVYEFGAVDGIHYLTMEEIDGLSVLDLLRRANQDSQPAPIGVSLWVLREILCALDYAMTGLDENGEPFSIVHRDLSPSNIIITHQGGVKIIDFGVAKGLLGRYATNSGRIKGKLGYMSPEALAGREIDSRSDLYSLAVLGWELLTAQRLFRGTEQQQLSLRASKHERTPPSAHNPWVPAALDKLLAVALSENPTDRHGSARAMLGALEPLLMAEGKGASAYALRTWMRQLEGTSEGKESATNRVKNHSSHQLRALSPIPMLTSGRAIPGVRRFHEVHTEVDVGLGARVQRKANGESEPDTIDLDDLVLG